MNKNVDAKTAADIERQVNACCPPSWDEDVPVSEQQVEIEAITDRLHAMLHR
jgi:hypothetical protein